MDVATPGGLHMCGGQCPYTDMMCLTKAAAAGQDRGQRTEEREKTSEEEEKAAFKSRGKAWECGGLPS